MYLFFALQRYQFLIFGLTLFSYKWFSSLGFMLYVFFVIYNLYFEFVITLVFVIACTISN